MKASRHFWRNEHHSGQITKRVTMKDITNVGIVGAGTMGAALAQKFIQEGFAVTLADRSMKIVQKGITGIQSTLRDAVEKRLFTESQVEQFMQRLNGTDTLAGLAHCDLVIEAIYENFEAKSELFQTLSTIVSADCILATNTSSFSVSELAESVRHPERFIGLHYFYHAAKNRLVEIIPGSKTAPETFIAAQRFSFLSGKDAITCADSYGFVVNRYFVPWLNESARLLGEGYPIDVIDAVCKQVFGIGMGPFELMNATGIPVAYHSEKTLERYGNLYTVSEVLEKQALANTPWLLGTTPDSGLGTPEQEREIADRMLGVVFFVCLQLLDENVCSVAAINRGAKIGLKWKRGPFEMMNRLGEDAVRSLVCKIAALYTMPMPNALSADRWKSDNVKLEKNGSIAIITMDQPEYQNAFSEETMRQLATCFDNADNDPDIKTIFFTGSGKAFVAGADITYFVTKIKSNNIDDIIAFTKAGQDLFERIDTSNKTIVSIINGLALGGGLEFALCSDIVLALPKAQLAFPETAIGIYPGLGGTQRSTRKLGKGLSKFLIFTGKMLSASEAAAIGLVDKIVTPQEMFAILAGEAPIPGPANTALSPEWSAIAEFFSTNSLSDIVSGTTSEGIIDEALSQKFTKMVQSKAPVALRLADELITKAAGCSSELNHLSEIFSTSDALLGLTSIGKKVEYQGK